MARLVIASVAAAFVAVADCGDRSAEGDNASTARQAAEPRAGTAVAEPTAAETCVGLVVWRPDVLPGHSHEVDPVTLAPLAADALSDLGRQQDISLEIDGVEGFLIQATQTECENNQRAFAYWLSQQEAQVGSGDTVTVVQYSFAGSPDDYSETLSELNDWYVDQDRTYLGLPPTGDETTTAAGPNGDGRCNIYGTRLPATELLNGEPPLATDHLYSEFFDASLIEVNERAYDDVLWFFYINDVFGIAAYGDCEEASQRAADYLDRTIARMDGWGVDRPVVYRLFLPEQVEGLRENEILQRWEAGEIAPRGRTNAQ